MTFLSATLLFGLAAAAVPVIIHLLHRQRTVPVRWGAMQFLLETPLKFRRRKKVDHWLLLLARMGMLALLAFLLARPLVSNARFNPLPATSGADVAVVLDHSLSTGRRANNATEVDFGELSRAASPAAVRTVFERGVAAVERIGHSLRPNDTLGVVLAEHRPNTSLTPLPVRSGALGELTRNLAQLKPGLTAANVPDAVQAARELLARGPNTQKVILLVTDEQRNAWQIDNAAAWSGALGDRSAPSAPKLYSLPVPPEPAARDVSVGDLAVEPSVVGVKRPAQVTATVTNSGPGDVASLTATLVVNGKEIGRQSVADPKAGGSRTVRFDHAFADAGSNWVQVRVDADDALAADNSALAAVNVRQRLSVLVIDGQLTGAGGFRASQFLVAAMQPVADDSPATAALIQPKVISAGAADAEKLDDYDAVVVNDVPQLPAAAAENLAIYARSGHGVWLVMGPRFDPSLAGRQFAETGLFAADFGAKKSDAEHPAGVELRSPQNPTVALLAAAERNAMTGAATKVWWPMKSAGADEQVVLAASGSGDPLVVERPAGRGGGRVVAWLTSADGAWNNWPLMPNFVPLVNETIYHLAGAGALSSTNRRLDAGMPIEWSAGPDPKVKIARITRPDGTTVAKQPTFAGGRQRVGYNDTADPGLYTIRFDPTEVPQPVYFGVNIDRKELDPATLTDADYAWLKNRGFVEGRIKPADVAAALGGASSETELWHWLALGVLGLLLFESFMTHRMVTLQGTPTGRNDAHLKSEI